MESCCLRCVIRASPSSESEDKSLLIYWYEFASPQVKDPQRMSVRLLQVIGCIFWKGTQLGRGFVWHWRTRPFQSSWVFSLKQVVAFSSPALCFPAGACAQIASWLPQDPSCISMYSVKRLNCCHFLLRQRDSSYPCEVTKDASFFCFACVIFKHIDDRRSSVQAENRHNRALAWTFGVGSSLRLLSRAR